MMPPQWIAETLYVYYVGARLTFFGRGAVRAFLGSGRPGRLVTCHGGGAAVGALAFWPGPSSGKPVNSRVSASDTSQRAPHFI